MKKLSVVAFVLVAAAGCPPDKPVTGEVVTPGTVDPSSGKAATATDAGAATPSALGAGSTTTIGALPMTAPVLVVDGVTYLRGDLERAIAQHAASTGIPPDALDVRMRDALESPAYEKLIDRQLFSGEAKKRGLWPKPEEIAAEHDRILKSLPPAMTLEGFLQKLGTDDQGFTREIATDLALSKLFEALQKEQKPPDAAAVRKVYDDNKDKFVAPELASASHILVQVDRGASPAAVEAAQKRAEEIRREVAGKDKATFARVALAKSQDPRVKENKGDLGKFPKGAMVPELDDAAFKLKDGEVSGIVRTDFGLHILRGQGITKAGPRSFDEVKQMIEQREGGMAFMASLDRLVEGLRKSSKIQRVVEPAKPPPPGALGGGPPALPGLEGAPPSPASPPPAPPVTIPPGGSAG